MYEVDMPEITRKPNKFNLFTGKRAKISDEDFVIITTLNQLNSEINCLHNCLDNITDPVLIDSYIFEIQAVHMRYKYYLQMCKEKGIISSAVEF